MSNFSQFFPGRTGAGGVITDGNNFYVISDLSISALSNSQNETLADISVPADGLTNHIYLDAVAGDFWGGYLADSDLTISVDDDSQIDITNASSAIIALNAVNTSVIDNNASETINTIIISLTEVAQINNIELGDVLVLVDDESMVQYQVNSFSAGENANSNSKFVAVMEVTRIEANGEGDGFLDTTDFSGLRYRSGLDIAPDETLEFTREIGSDDMEMSINENFIATREYAEEVGKHIGSIQNTHTYNYRRRSEPSISTGGTPLATLQAQTGNYFLFSTTDTITIDDDGEVNTDGSIDVGSLTELNTYSQLTHIILLNTSGGDNEFDIDFQYLQAGLELTHTFGDNSITATIDSFDTDLEGDIVVIAVSDVAGDTTENIVESASNSDAVFSYIREYIDHDTLRNSPTIRFSSPEENVILVDSQGGGGDGGGGGGGVTYTFEDEAVAIADQDDVVNINFTGGGVEAEIDGDDDTTLNVSILAGAVAIEQDEAEILTAAGTINFVGGDALVVTQDDDDTEQANVTLNTVPFTQRELTRVTVTGTRSNIVNSGNTSIRLYASDDIALGSGETINPRVVITSTVDGITEIDTMDDIEIDGPADVDDILTGIAEGMVAAAPLYTWDGTFGDVTNSELTQDDDGVELYWTLYEDDDSDYQLDLKTTSTVRFNFLNSAPLVFLHNLGTGDENLQIRSVGNADGRRTPMEYLRDSLQAELDAATPSTWISTYLQSVRIDDDFLPEGQTIPANTNRQTLVLEMKVAQTIRTTTDNFGRGFTINNTAVVPLSGAPAPDNVNIVFSAGSGKNNSSAAGSGSESSQIGVSNSDDGFWDMNIINSFDEGPTDAQFGKRNTRFVDISLGGVISAGDQDDIDFTITNGRSNEDDGTRTGAYWRDFGLTNALTTPSVISVLNPEGTALVTGDAAEYSVASGDQSDVTAIVGDIIDLINDDTDDYTASTESGTENILIFRNIAGYNNESWTITIDHQEPPEGVTGNITFSQSLARPGYDNYVYANPLDDPDQNNEGETDGTLTSLQIFGEVYGFSSSGITWTDRDDSDLGNITEIIEGNNIQFDVSSDEVTIHGVPDLDTTDADTRVNRERMSYLDNAGRQQSTLTRDGDDAIETVTFQLDTSEFYRKTISRNDDDSIHYIAWRTATTSALLTTATPFIYKELLRDSAGALTGTLLTFTEPS